MEVADLQGQNEDVIVKQSNKLLISLESDFCNSTPNVIRESSKKIPTKIVYSENAFKKKQKILPVQTVPIMTKEDLKGIFPWCVWGWCSL